MVNPPDGDVFWLRVNETATRMGATAMFEAFSAAAG